ncbi:hypothetical protein BD413DRAFT_542522, partial [Trametes elegans]
MPHNQVEWRRRQALPLLRPVALSQRALPLQRKWSSMLAQPSISLQTTSRPTPELLISTNIPPPLARGRAGEGGRALCRPACMPSSWCTSCGRCGRATIAGRRSAVLRTRPPPSSCPTRRPPIMRTTASRQFRLCRWQTLLELNHGPPCSLDIQY